MCSIPFRAVKEETPKMLTAETVSGELAQGPILVSDHSSQSPYQHAADRVSKRNGMAIQNPMAIQYLLNRECEDTSSQNKGSTFEHISLPDAITSGDPISVAESPETEMTACESRRLSIATTLQGSESESLKCIRGSVSGTPESGIRTSKDTTPDRNPADEKPTKAEGGPVTGLGLQRPARYHADYLSKCQSHVDKIEQKRTIGPCRTIGKSKVAKLTASPRSYRHGYTYEQKCAIWFLTTDIPHDRTEGVQGNLQEKFHSIFPAQERSLQGLLSWLYRSKVFTGLDDPRREQKKSSKQKKGLGPGQVDPLKYGMWAVKRHKFPWMDEFANRLEGYTVGGPYLEGEPRSC